MAFFINKNYKINLHVTISQTGTNLKPEFENDSQTRPRERREESEEPNIDSPPMETQVLAAASDSPSPSRC